MHKAPSKIIKVLSISILAVGLMAIYWYLFIALKTMPMNYAEILSSYNYQAPQDINFALTPLGNNQFSFSFTSFDGNKVNGQIRYPQVDKQTYPVLLGVSAMGRSHQRWWGSSYKGSPTITQVNKITDIANNRGYVVITIDARYHGSRKDPELPLSTIMNKLHILGDKTDYENMIRKTVLDYRVLIDWISSQPQLDENNISLAGYSMGAQIVLLLSALEDNIQKVISVVPPYLDNKVSAVAPTNLVSHSRAQDLLLVSTDDDEFASEEENRELFALIKANINGTRSFPGAIYSTRLY